MVQKPFVDNRLLFANDGKIFDYKKQANEGNTTFTQSP